MSSDSVDSFYWIRVILASTDADWRQIIEVSDIPKQRALYIEGHRKVKQQFIWFCGLLFLCLELLTNGQAIACTAFRSAGVGRCRPFGFGISFFIATDDRVGRFVDAGQMGRDTTCSTSPGTAKCTPILEIFYRQNLYCPTWWACWSSNQPAITAISTQATHQALLHVHHQNNQSSSVCARLQLVRHIAGTDISYRVDG